MDKVKHQDKVKSLKKNCFLGTNVKLRLAEISPVNSLMVFVSSSWIFPPQRRLTQLPELNLNYLQWLTSTFQALILAISIIQHYSYLLLLTDVINSFGVLEGRKDYKVL